MYREKTGREREGPREGEATSATKPFSLTCFLDSDYNCKKPDRLELVMYQS